MSDHFRCGHPKTDRNSKLERNPSRRHGYVERCRRCYNAHQRKAASSERRKALEAAKKRRQRATRRLEPGDPRHGTVSGYTNWNCRERCCLDAVVTAKRVLRLKAKCREIGIPIPRELSLVKSVVSLDAVADAFYGMDRINPGTVWDDPTADYALERAS